MGGWGLAAAAAAGGGRGVGDGAGGAQTGGGAPLHRPSAGGKGAASLVQRLDALDAEEVSRPQPRKQTKQRQKQEVIYLGLGRPT